MKRLNKQQLVVAVLTAIISYVWIIGPLTSVSYAQNIPQDQSQLIAQAQEPGEENTPPTLDPDAEEPTVTVDEGDLPPQETCRSSFPGLGWILCPIAESTYAFFDWLVQNILAERLLRIDLIDDEPTLRFVWQNFRTLSNLIFVIAFLVIIYGEATGRFGALEAYSFTRLLPRIAFAVIGVQLSYFIVAYLIALFNDLGAGAMQLVLAPLDGFQQFELAGVFSNITEGDTFFGQAVNVGGNIVDNLAGLLITAGVGLAGIFMLPLLLFYGVLGLLLLFLVLLARKLLVVVLVILAPVAFALFVLPNTERFFKQWWDLLIRALMMYPLIMIFIGAGQLVGRLVIAGENTTFLDSVIGFTVTFLPLFLVPLTFRLAGSVLNTVLNLVRNAEQRIAGDPRDPNSIRSSIRNQQRQTYGRVMNRDATWKSPISGKRRHFVPRRASIMWNALPGVDSSASLTQDIIQGRDTVKNITTTGDDSFPIAMAVTGGGNLKGPKISVWDGDQRVLVNAGYKKLGTHLAFNNDGSIMRDSSGMAVSGDGRGNPMLNADGSYRTLKKSDFYSDEVMSQVKKFSNQKGLFHASAEYAMTKADYLEDQQQVIEGIGASSWSAGEKSAAFNGAWYNTKDFHQQNKFIKTDPVFSDDPRSDVRPLPQMEHKMDKMVEFVDTRMRSFDLGNQSGAFWQAINQNMTPEKIQQVRGNMRQEERELFDARIHNMAWKAQNFINTERQFPRQQMPGAEPGSPEAQLTAGGYMSASQTVGAAERGAREFLRSYKDTYGRLPPTDGIEEGIRPIR